MSQIETYIMEQNKGGPMTPLDLAKNDLFSLVILLAAGLVGSQAAKKLRVPDIVVFLLFGMGLGALGILRVPQGAVLNQVILTAGACFLLFEGGTTLRFKVLGEIWITLAVLATLGVGITAAVTTGLAVWAGLPFLTALLLALVTAPTDPAALVPVFRQVKVRPRVSQTVLGESAFNDAVGAIGTFAVVGVILGVSASGELRWDVWGLLGAFGWEAGAGLVIGIVLGWLASVLIAHRTFGWFRGSEVLVLVVSVLGAYLFADGVGASGFMAVFVLGIMAGNRDTLRLRSAEHHQLHLDHSLDNLSLVLRTGIFVLLGSQVEWAGLARYWGLGLGLLTGFVFLARPAAVFLCAGPDRRARWSWQELVFMCWTRETGVIPAALVGLLAGEGVPGMETVAPVALIFIVGTLLIQAPTTGWLAKKLGLLVS